MWVSQPSFPFFSVVLKYSMKKMEDAVGSFELLQTHV
jgi:hypothetical protein